MIPKKEELIELYVNKQLTANEISEYLKVDKSEIIQLLKDFEIDLNPTPKKFRLINKIPINDQQREFIVGLLLGKARLEGNAKSGIALYTEESLQNKDHLLWKKMILGNYVNAIVETKDKCFFRTAKLNDFVFFSKLMYDNNKKIIKEDLANYLTFFGLATWFSESAIIRKDNIRFSTFMFSKEENEILQRILKFNFALNSKVCEYKKFDKTYYYISINKRNSQLMMEKIGKYLNQSSETTC